MRNLIIIVASMLLTNCGESSSYKSTNDTPRDSSNSIIERSETSQPNVTQKKRQIPQGRCDIRTVVNTEENIDSLTSLDIYSFLFTFSEECKNNAEFTEISNEILFKVLLKYPTMLSENLSKDSIHQSTILKEIANPVIELESIDQVIRAINTLQIPDTVKSDVIKRLKNTI